MIKFFFGSPGAGKTTTAVRDLKKLQKRNAYDYYFTNFETTIPGVCVCDLDKIGEWTFPPHSVVFIDEAGIKYNNRKYKTLPQAAIEWFKLSRHYKVDIYLYSQGLDVDITLFRLCHEYWYLRKLGPFTLCREIRKFVHIDQEHHDIVDGYEFRNFWLRFLPFPFHRKTWYAVFRPFHYKDFDSYSTPDTTIKYFGADQTTKREPTPSALRLLAKPLSLVCSSVKRALRVASHRPAQAGAETNVSDQTKKIDP